MAAPLGNQNAKKAKLWEGAIKRAIARKAAGDLNNGLDSLADKLIAAAESGDQWALKELGDRIDGKPHQSVGVAGDDEGGPVKLEAILIRAVDGSP
jgi:hypothetical protein